MKLKPLAIEARTFDELSRLVTTPYDAKPVTMDDFLSAWLPHLPEAMRPQFRAALDELISDERQAASDATADSYQYAIDSYDGGY
ncbi:MAG TPA: hypothetical protein VF175_15515 [Lacipirellula sp.]